MGEKQIVSHKQTCLSNFDATFYLSEYPDVLNSKMNPLMHYIEYGFYEGRKPFFEFQLPVLEFDRKDIENYIDLPIKLFIPTFNNPTYLLNFMRQVLGNSWLEPIIYDNNSRSKKMINLLSSFESKGVKVIRRKDNLGPESIYLNPGALEKLPEYFLLSDPDLDLKNTFSLEGIRDMIYVSEFFNIGKVGYALKISKNKITRKKLSHGKTYISTFDWEQQFWKNVIGKFTNGDTIYSASVGATYCLVNKKYLDRDNHWTRGIRIAGSRTIIHIPWEECYFIPFIEKKIYQRLQKHSFYTQPGCVKRIKNFLKNMLTNK